MTGSAFAQLDATEPFTAQPLAWPEQMTDLGLEFGARAAALPFVAVSHLIDIGVPAPFVARLTGQNDLALARVALGHRGLFTWEGDQRRLLLAVRDEGAVVDVCALRLAKPQEWHLLTGAGRLLGDEWLRAALIGTVRTLRIFGDPLAWMRGSGSGVCVLRWSRETISELRSLGEGLTLLCDDQRAARRLNSILAWDHLPAVRIHKDRVAA